jgi:hypothetical protein
MSLIQIFKETNVLSVLFVALFALIFGLAFALPATGFFW